jgi:putative nucleotidyltransferase with HDIG domain
LRLLVAAVAFAGFSILVYAIRAPEFPDLPLLIALILLAVAAERTDFSAYGSSRVSLAFIPIFGSVISHGLTGLALVVPAAVAASAWGRPAHKTAFNFGALMISGLGTYWVLRGFPGETISTDLPDAFVPAILAGAANYGVNSGLVAIAISLSGRISLRNVWSESFLWLFPHYVILALIGLSMVAAYGALGIWGLGVFLAPPLMMRLSIKQHLDRTARSVLELRRAHTELQHAHDQVTEAMTSLGQAYDGTLRSLVAALDARDSETAGHSERVADLTMAIAAELGFKPGSDEWRYLSWGAVLHDVGKIAIPDGILRKAGSLTEDEWIKMRSHANAGFEILRSVDFLTPASEIVLCHHERWDGGGYPRGLKGEEIPFGARIFTIADSFDAMTSDRSYRSAMAPEEALAEVLRCSGSQFDPTAVRAFLSVYQERFVDAAPGRRYAGATHGAGARRELSESLKKAIAEAAGLEQ